MSFIKRHVKGGNNMTIKQTENGLFMYEGDTFKIILTRYSDPKRLNLARNAAIYLGKSDRDNIRRPLNIIKQGHVPEIFRGEHAEFEFIDVSKEVYDHIVTYTTRNMRVAGGNRALVSDDFTMPSDKMKDEARVRLAIDGSMKNYQWLLEIGETPQVARSAMPVNAKMNPFVYQFNFLTLGAAIFPQRIWEKGAQSNTAKVVKGMWELCHNIDPELWDTFYEYYGIPMLEWKEVRKKLKKHNFTIGQLLNELHKHALEGTENPDTPVIDYLVKRFGEMKSMW
jgi:Thymidylate synthase complementing protein